jgi:hypothetical protein
MPVIAVQTILAARSESLVLKQPVVKSWVLKGHGFSRAGNG